MAGKKKGARTSDHFFYDPPLPSFLLFYSRVRPLILNFADPTTSDPGAVTKNNMKSSTIYLFIYLFIQETIPDLLIFFFFVEVMNNERENFVTKHWSYH